MLNRKMNCKLLSKGLEEIQVRSGKKRLVDYVAEKIVEIFIVAVFVVGISVALFIDDAPSEEVASSIEYGDQDPFEDSELPRFEAKTIPVDEFFYALHQLESGGDLNPPAGDDGLSSGPLQISWGFWKDSGVGGEYKDCRELGYAKKVSMAYYKRYEPRAVEARDYYVLFALHQGGPSWRRGQSPRPFAERGLSIMQMRQESQ